MSKKFSPKVKKTAEDFLVSLNSSRQQLTDNQWRVLAEWFRIRRFDKAVMACSLLLGIFLLCLTILYWIWMRDEVTRVVPSRPLIVFKKGSRDAIVVYPYEIENHMETVSSLSFYTGPAFILSMVLFMIIIVLPLHRRRNKRIFEAFIPNNIADDRFG